MPSSGESWGREGAHSYPQQSTWKNGFPMLGLLQVLVKSVGEV